MSSTLAVMLLLNTVMHLVTGKCFSPCSASRNAVSLSLSFPRIFRRYVYSYLARRPFCKRRETCNAD